ncbi:MAG TPA: hypothetical protein VGI61_11275 [Parafilimonas sp.]|jgi:hypothetical protein
MGPTIGIVFEFTFKKIMGKYRALFEDKVLKSVTPTKEETPENDTFLEETTGSTIWAIIEATSDDEAQEKAERLETELQTGQTKETLHDKENSV